MSTLLKIHLLLRKKLFSQKFLAGFSVIEVIMAAALFLIFSGGLVTLVLQGFNSNRLAEEETIASQYATEGMEAVRSIRNQGYTNLVNTTGTGVIQSNGVWTFSGANNTYASGKYTRVIAISSVNRDASNNIVSSGGTLDPNTKKAVVTVTWNYTPTRNDSVVLTNYFTNWRVTENTQSSGMLVYGDGGTTSNAVKYQIFNGLNWNTAAATATLGTANRALRAVRVYSATSQPVFDSAASAVQNSGTSLTFSDTVGSGTNRLLIVALAYRAHNNVNAEGLSVTYNGVPLNKITRNTNVDRDSEMWYLVAPASGAHNVVVTMSADPEDMVATAISYSNVNQTTPIGLPCLN